MSQINIKYAIKRGDKYACGDHKSDLTSNIDEAILYDTEKEARFHLLPNESEKIIQIRLTRGEIV